MLVWVINREQYPATAAELLAVLAVLAGGFGAVALYRNWSSRTGKLQLREQMLDTLDLKGDERSWMPVAGWG